LEFKRLRSFLKKKEKKEKKRKRQTIFQENHIDTALNMFYKLKKNVSFIYSRVILKSGLLHCNGCLRIYGRILMFENVWTQSVGFQAYKKKKISTKKTQTSS